MIGGRMKTFYLNRLVDVSGISGIGKVCEGIMFSDGKCVINWLGEHPSIEVHESIDEVKFIHGHKGKTEVIWE